MAHRKAVLWLMLAAALTACGNPFSSASRSTGHSQGTPTPSATAQPTSSSAPQPVTAPVGVLVSSQAANSYTVSLVGVDGKVVATSEVSTPPAVNCLNGSTAPVTLPVSTSDSRVYFMDAQGVVRFLAPNGDSGRATTVPAGSATRRSMFAVSPDDQRIAVVVDDYTSSGATTKLYVEDLNGNGNHLDLFSETGARTLWPVGWHTANNLVLAVAPSCASTGGPFCCGIQELHVVDPATATRRFTIGSAVSCIVVGWPSRAGAICEDISTYTQATVLSWTALTQRTFKITQPTRALLSPNGRIVAIEPGPDTAFVDSSVALLAMQACAWIDDTHLMSGGDPQHPPKVADVTTGSMVTVAAQGDCGGRLPGGL
ncbi:MAG TPA: hypothetical protein VJQ08_02060 [Candidatus Dormibacteraeota bacterium]|nr:hypothetical protein [Candidatus Dormibacteraeota bacterium]